MKALGIVGLLILANAGTSAAEPPLPAPVRAACNAEMQRLCPDAREPSQVLDCLRGSDRLSDRKCKNAIGVTDQSRTTTAAGGYSDASRKNEKTVPPQ